MKITDVEVTVVEIPQVWPIAPYRSRLRTSATTQSAIVRLETDAGLVGWGEFNVNFLPDLSGQRLTQEARAWIVGRDATNVAAFHRDCPLNSRLRSGLELAMWDLLGKSAGLPVAELLGGVIREDVEVAACMGIQSYERAGEIASHYVEQGFRALKTKAGADVDEDVAMVRGVRDAVGDGLKLRIDPNCGYTPERTVDLLTRLAEFDLEYVEQPMPEDRLADAAKLRRLFATPIALNESVVDPASVWAILKADAADVILPDTHIAGGILPCVEIGHVAHAAGVPCVMHCGHDLGPKTAAMLHVAAACPAYSLANDTTYFGLEDDVLGEPFEIVDGTIRVPTVPGLGAEVDPEKLARFRVEG